MHQFGGDLRLVAAAYYAGEKRIQAIGLRFADPAIYCYVMAVQHGYANTQVVAVSPKGRKNGTATPIAFDRRAAYLRAFMLSNSKSLSISRGHPVQTYDTRGSGARRLCRARRDRCKLSSRGGKPLLVLALIELTGPKNW